jgi:hypothetical protein
VDSLLKITGNLVPIPATATKMTTAIKEAMIAYSIEVTARLSIRSANAEQK